VALRAAKAAGKKCVLSVQEALRAKWFQIGENPIFATLFFLFERFVITRKYDAWHCISEATARDVRTCGIAADTIHPILLGIDDIVYSWPHEACNPASLFSEDPSKKTFLFFGRPGKTKGVGIFIDAIRKIRSDIPKDIFFGLILGAPPRGERERYIRRIKDEGLDTVIRVSPSVPREQLLSCVRGAYCVVVPSITEGFGFSAAETCALGTPIVVSDGGSLPEVVSGRHLFFRNRSATHLATTLQQAIRGEFQYREVRRLSWASSSENLMGIYRKLIG
jgi:glycosyltransferase involved in cell wall biosynthesis